MTMRSLIILEVEHEDDISDLSALVDELTIPSVFHKRYRISVLEVAVRVDLPPCFTLV